MSARLALHFLGPPQIQLNGTSVTLERRKGMALLAYLAVEQGRHSRASLSALLWPDYEQSKAYKNLRQILWEIQQSIGEGWIIADRESIGLSEEADIWLDVREFESWLVEGRRQTDIPLRASLLADSAKLYHNHFLTGFSLKDAHPFNDWAFAKSEELRHQLARALVMLSEDYCALGKAEKAIPYARRLIALDPLDEASHRQLMQVYIQAGQHSAALKQYQACEQLLRKELGVDPQPETRDLYKKIRKREIKPVQFEKPAESTLPRYNIPLQLSSFIGREKEQIAIAKLIAGNRLVTLVGTGGIGKTSLASQLGHKLLNDYPDGVWFIALDSLSDPALVPQTVAAVFDIRERSDASILELLINALRTKIDLLIFDNSEHLLDACAQLITALLQSCPGLKILATSREAFGMPGEAIYRIPSLSIPEQKEDSLAKLGEYEAVRMFAERAALVQSSFQLTNENIQTVAEICRKVDGIPLAIELAAARVTILQVDEILHQLEESFQVLASQSRITSARHQTLQASMDWSWGLLDEMERVFLRQLSIFAGGWTLESAQAVCDGNVLDLTSALVKKSLIVLNQQGGRDTRYRLHETIRQYVHEKLVEAGEEETIRSLHLKYFFKISEQIEHGLYGPQQVEWFARTGDELYNLRAALEWATKTDVEAGLSLASRLGQYWISFEYSEGLRWLTQFLQHPRAKEYPSARAHALIIQGHILADMEQHTPVRSMIEECLELYRTSGNQQREIDSLLLLARIVDAEKSVVLNQQALDLARSIDDVWREARALGALGWNRRDLKSALAHWEQAISLFRAVGDWRRLAANLSMLANYVLLDGDFEYAQSLLDESIELNQRLNNKALMGNILFTKGNIAFRHGDYELARASFQQHVIIHDEIGQETDWARLHLGYIALREGNLAEAHQIFDETALNFHKNGNIKGLASTLEGIASLNVLIGEPESAMHLIGWADATREQIGVTRWRVEQADVDKIIAACVEKMGKAEFTKAYEEGKKMSLDEAIAYALEELKR